MNGHGEIPDVLLERYRLGELPRAEADRIADLVRTDAALRARLDALAMSDRELLESGTIDAVSAAVERRGRNRCTQHGRGRRRAVLWIVSAAAAVTIAAAVMSRGPSGAIDSGDRIKGLQPALALYRRTRDGSEPLADGSIARRGDLVRVGYRPAGRAYGVIFSIDGRGVVTMHLPPGGNRAVALAHESAALLDRAYELDDAPLWERFYFVAGDAPFEVAPIVAAARRAPESPLGLPRGVPPATF